MRVLGGRICTHEGILWKVMYPWGYWVEGYVPMRVLDWRILTHEGIGWKDMYSWGKWLKDMYIWGYWVERYVHEGMYPEENVNKDLFLIFPASGCILFSSHTPRWNKNNCPFLPETCLVFIFIIIHCKTYIIQYICIKNLCPKNCSLGRTQRMSWFSMI